MNDFERKMEAQMAKYFQDQHKIKKMFDGSENSNKPHEKLSAEKIFHLYTKVMLDKTLPIFDAFDATTLEKDTIGLVYLSKVNSEEPEFAVVIGINLKHNIRWNYEYTFTAIKNTLLNHKIDQLFPNWSVTHNVTKWIIGEELAHSS